MSLHLRARGLRRAFTARLTAFAHHVWASKGLISTLLLPLAWITAGVVRHKRRRYARRPVAHHGRAPVVVVGNIVVGGTGKTSVVMAVIGALQARGWTPGLISRGYGAPACATPRHGVGTLDPACFGDEPSLIAAHTGVPVAVHRDRVHALQVLEQHYPEVDVVIADDGLQHLALARDVEIVVQDSRGCGNERLLPAGPLREPARRLAEVDFLITQQDAMTAMADTALHSPERTAVAPVARSDDGAPPAATADVFAARATHVVRSDMILSPAVMHHLASDRRLLFDGWLARYGDAPVCAVAGIGVPQRFFQMLRHAGVRLEHTISLADHDDYRHPPFDRLPTSPILITPKDAVKCMHLQDDRLWAVHPRAAFGNATWLDVLEGRLRHVRWSRLDHASH